MHQLCRCSSKYSSFDGVCLCSCDPVITFVLSSIHLFLVSLKIKKKNKLVQSVCIVYQDIFQVLWFVLIDTFTVGWVFLGCEFEPTKNPSKCYFLCSRWWALQLTKEVFCIMFAIWCQCEVWIQIWSFLIFFKLSCEYQFVVGYK